MKLGTEVGLGPGHIVLDRDPAPLPKGHSPQFSADVDVAKRLALPPFWGGRAGSASNTMSLGSRPTFLLSGILIHPAIWPQQIWAENWGGGLCRFGERELGPHLPIWPGPRPTCMPNFILIRSTVWPEYTNVTNRTGQDRYKNIGRTNGPPKRLN